MSRMTLVLIMILITLLSLAACSPGAPKTVALTEKDANRTVELSKGGLLEVTLVGNPTTGFMWEPQSLDAALLQPKGEVEFTADNTTPGFVGSPGKLTLRFEAVGSGQTTLKLVYHQPWDTATPPAQTFEVTVVVK